MHVLYVDDNPTNRDELEEQLDFIAPEWQFTFASTIEEAERELQSDTINALITRADVDGSDADSLLKLSSEVHPAAIRVLVEEVHRTRDIFIPATLAHQYLLAPVDPVQLVSAVQRLKDLQSEIYSDALQNIIIRIGRLPSLPALYSEIIREISHPSGTLDNVGKIITRDVAMSAKILQLSNSPFFGFTTRIMDLSHAVFVLGMNTITGLVLTNGIFSDIKVSAASGVDPERLMEHSTDVALVARAMAMAENLPREMVDMAYVGGFLHDIGHLILASNLSEDMATVHRIVREKHVSIENAEFMVFGATHAQIGGSLLGLWGFPSEVIEAVLRHHHPRKSSDQKFSPLTAVHVADALVKKYDGGIQNADIAIDPTYLTGLDMLDKVDGWAHKYQNIDHDQRDPKCSA